MKEWTFLLQKDGDRSWLPLDSSDVEILEGRYRIVAQTDQPNTDISIRICHLATEEDPPKRRIQKRSNRTNRNGLMVVTPFTQLQPGNWELCCFLTDPMSDLVGDMLHHAVRLRVLACVEETTGDWDGADAVTAEGSINTSINATPATNALIVEELSQIVVSQSAASVSPDSDLATVAASPEEELLPTTQDIAALNVEIAQALGFSMDRLVEMTDQLSHQLIEEIFKEFNLPEIVEPLTAEPFVPIEAEEQSVDSTPEPENEPVLNVHQLQLVLAQDGWVAARGESLAIAGRLELAAVAIQQSEYAGSHDNLADNQIDADLEGATPQEIQIQLRDPQTAQVLFHACQSFPSGKPPLNFSFLCNLPSELKTHLLLGEVIIAGVLPGAESVLITLKTVPFSITVDPQGLVEEMQKVKTALAKEADQEELPDLVTQFSNRLMQQRVGHNLDLSFLNMAAPVTETVASEDDQRLANESVAKNAIAPKKQILPPQLYQPDLEQAGKRKLELPIFAGVGAKAGATAIAVEPELTPGELKHESEQVFAPSEAELQAMILSDSPTFDRSESDNPLVQASNLETHPTEQNRSAQPTDSPAANANAAAASSSPATAALEPNPSPEQADLAMFEELSSPIRSAFQALNLQDKFLNRLSSMAADAELSTLLKLTMPQTETAEVAQETAGVAVESVPVQEAIAEANTTEVVVDDDPSWREWVKRAGSRPKPVEPIGEMPTDNPLLLSPEEPVPMPRLETGIDDIVAGKPINVRITLPNLLPKIYVKLWVNDRQTRTLLDGPRWLVDFLPNGFDEIEASTQIVAPFGSLHIRLEAIAVEIHTQRESQKVILDCEVIPSELPDDLFDDLDL
ncbi:MAG: hypothetical protein NW224_30260 [Leptolyngbyaceae cyanobacterium bins.302]|nr:hypothetical protein [Leptolyngbyaceae cyanobacterium bins.302]